MNLDKMFAIGETFFKTRFDSSTLDMLIDEHVIVAITHKEWKSDSLLVVASGKSFRVWDCHARRCEAEAERAAWIVKQQANLYSQSLQLRALIEKLTARGEWPLVIPDVEAAEQGAA